MLNIASPCNDTTKLLSHQTCARIRFWGGKYVLTLEFALYDS